MKKIKIEVGDCSGDGHSISEVVELLCNKTIEELSLLYKKSCELTGLQFTTNGDESGQDRDWQEMGKWKVLQGYEQYKVTEFQQEKFAEFGINIEDLDFSDDKEKFTQLFLEFLRLSDPKLKWEFVESKREEMLSLYIGYGIYRI